MVRMSGHSAHSGTPALWAPHVVSSLRFRASCIYARRVRPIGIFETARLRHMRACRRHTMLHLSFEVFGT